MSLPFNFLRPYEVLALMVSCEWQSAQILAKPDLTPMAWVKRLVVLCDQAPQTPFATVVKVLEQELGGPVDDVFERFDVEPLGCASIAQVHNKSAPSLLSFCFRQCNHSFEMEGT